MKAAYQPIDRWSIPQGAVDVTLQGLRIAGASGNEGGALWLGERGSTARVLVVALPRGPGVVERPGIWQMSTGVYAQVGVWAATQSVVLLALVHSHRSTRANYLSELDKFASVHVPDFLSIVVGGFGADLRPKDWGFHVFEHDRFKRLSQVAVANRISIQDGSVRSVECDERGVRTLGV